MTRRRRRWHLLAGYAAQMAVYLALYAAPYRSPEALRARLGVQWPLRVDRALGLGRAPAVRLQRWLARPGEVARHDVALACLHWSWFFVPHGIVARSIWRDPEGAGPRAAIRMSATFDVGLLGYWLVPTAPPWWASRAGQGPPTRRLMEEAGEVVWGPVWPRLFSTLEGNPWAAMPSVHFATAVTGARLLAREGSGPAALGTAYAAALGLGLVYLGEHYVVDLAAGLALSEGVRVAVERLYFRK